MSAAIKCFGALWIMGAIGRIITPIGMVYTGECLGGVVMCVLGGRECGVWGGGVLLLWRQ
jgi:hypothetical protein